MDTKTCRLCREAKPREEFYRDKGSRDGYRNDCKACNRAASARRYRENPGPAIARSQQWMKENRERYNDRMRRYRDSGKKAIADRKSYLKRTYGLTLEQYDAMLASQDGVCAICGKPPSNAFVLHVDHDHVTGAIRGLLHFTCNNLLGDAEDDPVVLRNAASYVEAADPEAPRLAALARERAYSLVSSQ